MARFEIAIWHPTMKVEEIEKKVDMRAKLSWSFGSERITGSGTNRETYCRFDIGTHTKYNGPDILHLIKPFESFISDYVNIISSATCILYITLNVCDPECYLDSNTIEYISSIGIGVVFRASDK